MNHHSSKWTIAFLIFVLLLTGCSSNAANGTNNSNISSPGPTDAASADANAVDANEGKELATELKFPLDQSIPTLDPHLSLGGSNSTVVLNVFEGLFSFNSSYEPVPSLAESYEVSEDGKNYVFHLRQGITFHNGKELKAEDAAASLNRWKELAPRAKSSFGESEFEAQDDYTVVLNLNEPKNDTLAQLSHVLNFAAIMPKEVVESAGPDGVKEYIGTGPFKLVEWKADQYIHVSKFENYQSPDGESDGFAGKREALVNDIYFTLALDNATRFSSFLAGDFDYVDVSIDNLPLVENDDSIELVKDLSTDFNLIFNKKSPLFSDIAYRQAVAALVNAEEILLGITSTPDLYRLNPSYMYEENAKWYSEAGSEAYNQSNPEEAKRLLAEAGYNGEVVRLLTTKDTGSFYNASLMLQAQLEAIGVKTQLDIYDYATMLTKRADATAWDIYLGPFIVPSTPSQLLYLNPSYGFAEDAKLADLLKKATAALTDEEIKEANDELQAYVWEYLGNVKIGDTYRYKAIRSNLQGVTTLYGIPNLSNTKVYKKS